MFGWRKSFEEIYLTQLVNRSRSFLYTHTLLSEYLLYMVKAVALLSNLCHRIHWS